MDLDLGFKRAIAAVVKYVGGLRGVDDRGGLGRGGWWPIVREPYAGAWQRNDPLAVDSVLAHYAVYACITRIANAIGKLATNLTERDANGIWTPTTSPAFSPVLRRPNRYQNHIQFKQAWIIPKLKRGNAYILKERDARGVVVALYPLDPELVTVLVAPDGSVFYQLRPDNLSGIGETEIVAPASEIIHDRMNCLFHPLVGVSPLFAAGLAASQGLKMQRDSAAFFANGANPGGVLTAPGAISDETAKRLQDKWSSNYTGENAGKVAVMGDGLKFEPMRMKYVDAQLVDQMKLTADIVCSAFGVPPFKIGLGTLPAGMKVGDLNQLFYEDALHSLIEEMEACLDEGLALPAVYRTELDLDNLLRMDPATHTQVLADQVAAAITAPNEARRRLNMGPVPGGESPMIQQQNWSLKQLSKREAPPDAAAPMDPPQPDDDEEAAAQEARELLEYLQKGLGHAA